MIQYNLKSPVANTVCIILVLFSLISCKHSVEDCKYKLVVTSQNGNGWNKSWSSIKCDSVNMLSTNKAEIYIDGTKMNIESNNVITVHSNCN